MAEEIKFVIRERAPAISIFVLVEKYLFLDESCWLCVFARQSEVARLHKATK